LVHAFTYEHKGEALYFLYDIESGSLYKVDHQAFLTAKSRYGKPFTSSEERDFDSLENSVKEEIGSDFSELEKEGALDAGAIYSHFTKNLERVKALCLHIAHDCNMRCDYCFAEGGAYHQLRELMPAEVGKRAVDFLIENSGTTENLELDYFGGEPLMNMGAVKEITAYAREQGKKRGKEFFFTLTTNGVLLNKENVGYLNENMGNVVLSIDGREKTHNGVRHALNGKDTYPLILKNLKAFRAARGARKYFVRGTFTAKNLDFSEDVFKLNDEGFDRISVEPAALPAGSPLAIREGDLPAVEREYEKLAEGYLERRKAGKPFEFFHFDLDLEHGPCLKKRLTGCGAGNDYLAVSPKGELYPCHRFVGRKEYLLGDVFGGINNGGLREKFASNTVLSKPECADCPAKYYCGGGCSANALDFSGSINGVYKIGCAMTRKRFELSLALDYLEREK